jgi:hypothetical protein
MRRISLKRREIATKVNSSRLGEIYVIVLDYCGNIVVGGAEV